MTKKLLQSILLIFPISIIAQSGANLDINNVNARFHSNGIIGQDLNTSSPGFEVPKGGNNHTLFSSGLWISGLDGNGQLYLASQQYEGAGDGDYWSGPLTNDGLATISNAVSSQYDKVWKIDRSEVDMFLANGTISSSISNWPAHGDVLLGQDYYLAPFMDVNMDGDYNPSDGDYPCFPGDQAVFFIYNDRKQHSLSGAASLGVEIHVMAYAFADPNSILNESIFVHYKIKNQTTTTYSDSYIGLFADFDLGNPTDDYVGSDVTRGLTYVYNSDNNDEPIGGSGYGPEPPAFGIVMLQGPLLDPDGLDNPFTGNLQDAMDSLGIVYEGLGSGYGDNIVDNERSGWRSMIHDGQGFPAATTPIGFYNLLQGRWADGSSLQYGGNGYQTNPGQTAQFAFPGNTDPLGYGTGGNVQAPWSEPGEALVPGDRRTLSNFGSFTLEPGGVRGIDLAFVFARAGSGGQMASVAELQQRTDSIRSFFFNSGLFTGSDGPACNTSGSVSVVDPGSRGNSIKVFPVPSTDDVTVSIPDAESTNYNVLLYNLTGKVESTYQTNNEISRIPIGHLESGVYLLRISSGTGQSVHRIVKQ
jgi:hypothetical protein